MKQTRSLASWDGFCLTRKASIQTTFLHTVFLLHCVSSGILPVSNTQACCLRVVATDKNATENPIVCGKIFILDFLFFVVWPNWLSLVLLVLTGLQWKSRYSHSWLGRAFATPPGPHESPLPPRHPSPWQAVQAAPACFHCRAVRHLEASSAYFTWTNAEFWLLELSVEGVNVYILAQMSVKLIFF